VLGRAQGMQGYHDVRSYPDAELLPGLVMFRFDAPLIFANARVFRDQIRRLARTDPPPRWIVVAAEPITDVDTTAADVLLDLDHLLDERGQSLVFAEMKDRVRRRIERYGLTRAIEPGHFFPTVEAAVSAFRARTGAQWTSPAPIDEGRADANPPTPPEPRSSLEERSTGRSGDRVDLDAVPPSQDQVDGR
jgi:MFS superfamily sulfate permease-like transporter